GESFFANFLRLLGEPPRLAEAVFLEPISAGAGEGRRRIADQARERIIAAMEGRGVPDAGGAGARLPDPGCWRSRPCPPAATQGTRGAQPRPPSSNAPRRPTVGPANRVRRRGPPAAPRR